MIGKATTAGRTHDIKSDDDPDLQIDDAHNLQSNDGEDRR